MTAKKGFELSTLLIGIAFLFMIPSQPAGTIATDTLLGEARQLAQMHLHTIESIEYKWGRYEDSNLSSMIFSTHSDYLLVVAMRGEGYWNGPAGASQEPFPITGLTMIFDGNSDSPISMAGGYSSPANEFIRETSAPRTVLKQLTPLPESTAETEQNVARNVTTVK